MKKLKIIDSVAEKIIMAISKEDNYSSKIIKKTGVTYAHGTKIFNLLEESKIIKKLNIGRKKFIILTPKGEKIKEHLNKIKSLL